MHLLVGRENDCSGSNIPQNRVFQDWLPHPPMVVWNDLYKDQIGFIYFFNLLPLSYNVSAYKDQNEKLVCYWICECAKNVYSHLLAILWPNSFFLVTMATSNKLRDRNIAY